MKKLTLIFLCLAVGGFAGSTLADPVYLSGYDQGNYYDADKTGGDSNMCWAAAASNVLAWSGWGELGLTGGGDEDTVFADLKSTYGNVSGKAGDAWEDWFDDQLAGGYTFSDYFDEITPFATDYNVVGYDQNPNYVRYTDDRLRDYIDGGYGTVLSMQIGYTGTGASHALTVWGYDDTNFNDDQITIYVTDSDHDTDTLTAYTLYRGESLLTNPQSNPNEWYWDMWYNPYTSGLNGINNTWWVTGLQGLLPYDGSGPIIPPNGVVPEPGSLLLLGTGILGLIGIRKKFRK